VGIGVGYFKTATDDALPVWILGSADAAYCTNHADNIRQLTSIMFKTIVSRWLEHEVTSSKDNQ
jgi:hypothetical protein